MRNRQPLEVGWGVGLALIVKDIGVDAGVARKGQ